MTKDALADDKSVHKILKSLEKNIPVKGWRLDNGLLYYHDCIYVPNEPEIRKADLESRHDNPSIGHPGLLQTTDLPNQPWEEIAHDMKPQRPKALLGSAGSPSPCGISSPSVSKRCWAPPGHQA